MPKKAATARNGAQRTRPKAQKSFELVRPESAVLEPEESTTSSTSTATAVATQPASETSTEAATPVAIQPEPKTSVRAATKVAKQPVFKAATKAASVTTTAQSEPKTQESQIMPPAGSASARLAARRQAAQRMQQRTANTLITTEHFAYVRKDLVRIATFAVIMFSAIIVLYLTLGRG